MSNKVHYVPKKKRTVKDDEINKDINKENSAIDQNLKIEFENKFIIDVTTFENKYLNDNPKVKDVYIVSLKKDSLLEYIKEAIHILYIAALIDGYPADRGALFKNEKANIKKIENSDNHGDFIINFSRSFYATNPSRNDLYKIRSEKFNEWWMLCTGHIRVQSVNLYRQGMNLLKLYRRIGDEFGNDLLKNVNEYSELENMAIEFFS
jgi:hypothetical protein